MLYDYNYFLIRLNYMYDMKFCLFRICTNVMTLDSGWMSLGGFTPVTPKYTCTFRSCWIDVPGTLQNVNGSSQLCLSSVGSFH